MCVFIFTVSVVVLELVGVLVEVVLLLRAGRVCGKGRQLCVVIGGVVAVVVFIFKQEKVVVVYL